jgi:hypothetical protein
MRKSTQSDAILGLDLLRGLVGSAACKAADRQRATSARARPSENNALVSSHVESIDARGGCEHRGLTLRIDQPGLFLSPSEKRCGRYSTCRSGCVEERADAPGGAVMTANIAGKPLGYFGPSGAGDAGGLALFSANEDEMISLSRSPSGDGIISVFNALGQECGRITATQYGGVISTVAPDGDELVSSILDTEEGGSICVHDKNGEITACLLGSEDSDSALWRPQDQESVYRPSVNDDGSTADLPP